LTVFLAKNGRFEKKRLIFSITRSSVGPKLKNTNGFILSRNNRCGSGLRAGERLTIAFSGAEAGATIRPEPL
jgi:hypothetical protein